MALPTVNSYSGNAQNATITNATDVAGRVSLGFYNNGLAGAVIFNFGYTYVAPIIVITATNLISATNIKYIRAYTSTTTFTFEWPDGLDDSSDYTFNYHVFETQSAQPTNLTITTGAVGSASSRTNATDVAGHVSVTSTGAAGVGATITFGFAYVSPIVVITPTNQDAATDMDKMYVTTTTGTFVINFRGTPIASAHTYDYHVIETQSSNSSTLPAMSGTTYTTFSRTNSTDVAGNVDITTTTAAGTVTVPFTNTYANPIVIVSPISGPSALAMPLMYITSTTTGFTIHIAANAGAAGGTCKYSYHVIETQA